MKAFHAVWVLFGEAKTPVNVQLVVQLRGVTAVKKKNFAHLPRPIIKQIRPNLFYFTHA